MQWVLGHLPQVGHACLSGGSKGQVGAEMWRVHLGHSGPGEMGGAGLKVMWGALSVQRKKGLHDSKLGCEEVGRTRSTVLPLRVLS